jgi:hypothetical protein
LKASDSAAIVLIIGMLGSVLGLIALVSPKLLRLPSRWFAVPLITLIIGATGLGILIDPTDANGQSSPQSMREGGAVLLGFWLVISVVAVAISRSANVTGVSLKLPSFNVAPPPPQKYKAFDLGLSREPKPAPSAATSKSVVADASAAPIPDRSPEEVDAIRRSARKAAMQANAAVPALSPFAASDGNELTARLEQQFESLRKGAINLDDYRDAVLAEKEELADLRSDLRDDRRFISADEYEDRKAEIDELAEEVRWRLKWIDDQKYKQSISRDGFADSGRWARFEYVDNDGVVTRREIVNWETRGAYIVGFDRSKKAERTFRQDRISDWRAG